MYHDIGHSSHRRGEMGVEVLAQSEVHVLELCLL